MVFMVVKLEFGILYKSFLCYFLKHLEIEDNCITCKISFYIKISNKKTFSFCKIKKNVNYWYVNYNLRFPF